MDIITDQDLKKKKKTYEMNWREGGGHWLVYDSSRGIYSHIWTYTKCVFLCFNRNTVNNQRQYRIEHETQKTHVQHKYADSTYVYTFINRPRKTAFCIV